MAITALSTISGEIQSQTLNDNFSHIGEEFNTHLADYSNHIIDLTTYKSRQHKITPYLFGAIGDNSAHPLSERYATLEDAQAVYPFAVSLAELIDTMAIQLAFNTVEGTLDFSKGKYVVSGTGDACITLSRKLNLVGLSPNRSSIRGDNLPAGTSILKIAFDYNFGATEVRNWRMENLSIAQNGGGKHAVWIANGYFPLITSYIKNCNLAGYPDNDGYSIWAGTNLTHSKISLCTLSTSIYMNCGDANLIEKNTFFGTRVAVTFDCPVGVYNNTVRDNTIVNRDGAMHIINGDAIRFINNQVELSPTYTPPQSQSLTSSMVWVQGVDRVCRNIVISENNFGGGTNLDHLIYIDNARKAVIEKNQMIAVNVAEIYFTANAKYCVVKRDNDVRSTASNPRTRTAFKENVVDLGEGNAGVLKPGALLNSATGWTSGDFYKNECGMVHFYKVFNAGATSINTIFGTLPVGFRPAASTKYILYATLAGTGIMEITTAGVMKTVTACPSNSNVTVGSFPTDTTD